MKEYNLIPYPRKLWISKNINEIEKIKSEFILSEEDIKYLESDDYDGLCIPNVMRKSDEKVGYILIFEKLDDDIIIHEVFHVLFNLYLDMGMQISIDMDQEPFAYYCGYLFNLIKNG